MMELPIIIHAKPHATELMLLIKDRVENAIVIDFLLIQFAVRQVKLTPTHVWQLVPTLHFPMLVLVKVVIFIANTAVRLGMILFVEQMVLSIKMLV